MVFFKVKKALRYSLIKNQALDMEQLCDRLTVSLQIEKSQHFYRQTVAAARAARSNGHDRDVVHYRVASASRRRRYSSAGLHSTAEGDEQAQLAVDGNRHRDVPPHDRPRA